MNTKSIKAYYDARGLQWADQKSALLFFLSEVGELAEAYAEVEGAGLTSEEKELLSHFASLGLEADEIVSRKPGWVRNNDRLRKQNIAHEAADCNMMLSVFLESYANLSPDDALREKMALKLGCQVKELDEFLGIE
jgi:NTP pyrophosphatase (non-canonical NTP hydrolase)